MALACRGEQMVQANTEREGALPDPPMGARSPLCLPLPAGTFHTAPPPRHRGHGTPRGRSTGEEGLCPELDSSCCSTSLVIIATALRERHDSPASLGQHSHDVWPVPLYRGDTSAEPSQHSTSAPCPPPPPHAGTAAPVTGDMGCWGDNVGPGLVSLSRVGVTLALQLGRCQPR